MTKEELVKKICEFAREGKTGNRDETPWALLPDDCKFRQNGNGNNDALIMAEWNHPDIIAEDIQGAFVCLERIIESEPEAVANGFKKLIDVILTQSVCDRTVTVTDELLSNYEHFCKTIVRNLAVEGGQYVEQQDFKRLLKYIYKDNPYQTIKQGRNWHNSHQTHIQNMRIVGNAKSHDAQLGFLNNENNNYDFLQFELTALVLLVFDLSKGQDLRFRGQNPPPEDAPGPNPDPTEPEGHASLEQQAHDKYIEAIYTFAISGTTGDRHNQPWSLLPPKTTHYATWDNSSTITPNEIDKAFWKTVKIISKKRGVIADEFKKLLEILVNQTECDSTTTSGCLGNYEKFCKAIVEKNTVAGLEHISRLNLDQLLNQAYEGNPYQSVKKAGKWTNRHQTHIHNIRKVRNQVPHNDRTQFLRDYTNNHRFLQQLLIALVLFTFDLSKGSGVKLHKVSGLLEKLKKILEKLKTINRKTWIIITSVAVAILAIAIAVPIMIPDKKAVEEPVVQNSREHILEAIAGLEGYYYLQETNEGKLIGTIRTCQVKKFDGNTARILITSDYDPEVYEFTYSEDGTLYSQEMGSGNMTYKKKLEKIVLTFKKGDTTWKFSK